MQILLVRHGRSAHVADGRWLDRAGVARWREAYDAAAIADDDRPPAALVEAVRAADVIAASDLPRAVASARRLAPDRSPLVSPLLREEPLPIPRLGTLRASLAVWEALIHLRWGLDILRRDASPGAEARARAAAAWCRAACGGTDRTLVVVTHGVFRRLLARQLIADGWTLAPGRRSYARWSVWRLSAP